MAQTVALDNPDGRHPTMTALTEERDNLVKAEDRVAHTFIQQSLFSFKP
ncbi:hypothetical protein [Cupriavidus sp. U2]|nr:hypothetical protein [Cupriavidus sp. U2]